MHVLDGDTPLPEPTTGRGNRVCVLKETERREEKDEAIRRQEQTKKGGGCVRQRGGWL